MSNGIRLEVGKKYRSSCGDVWECVSNSDSTALPFRCKSGKRDTWFTAGGKYWIDVDKFSDDDLIEEVVDEDEILPGSIVPPEKLELAREMCRNGEPFFVTAKCNGPDSGYLPASAERTWEWDSDWFYIKRGSLTSEPDDPQGDVELRDDGEIAEPAQLQLKTGKRYVDRKGRIRGPLSVNRGLVVHYPFEADDKYGRQSFRSNGRVIDDSRTSGEDLIEEVAEAATQWLGTATTHGESRRVTIKPGEEFTADDTEKVAAAKRMQSEGVQFEVLTDDGLWRVPPWTIRFNSGDFRYRRKPEDVQCGDEPQGIKLEVGKKYRSRKGDVWECIGYSQGAKRYPFLCHKLGSRSVTDVFCESGKAYSWKEYDDDLIEEVVDIEPRQVDDARPGEFCEDYRYTLTGTQLRRELLRQVESCVCADRQNTYGDAEDNFENIADLANVVLQDKLADPLDAADVAIFSICIKLARLIESPHHIDNWIDGAGYFICGGGIATRSKQSQSNGEE